MKTILYRILIEEQGTGLTEYALVTVCIGLSLVGLTGVMLPAIAAYLKRICIFVSLPIP